MAIHRRHPRQQQQQKQRARRVYDFFLNGDGDAAQQQQQQQQQQSRTALSIAVEVVSVTVVLMIFSAISVDLANTCTPTKEETNYLASTFVYANRDFRFPFYRADIAPLPQVMASWTLKWTISDSVDDYQEKVAHAINLETLTEEWDVEKVGIAFRSHLLDHSKQLSVARRLSVGFAVLLALVVYLQSKKVWCGSSSSGFFSLLLFIGTPLVLSTSAMLTRDMPSALFLILAVVSFWNTLIRNRKRYIVMLGVALAGCVLTAHKRTALVVLPCGYFELLVFIVWKCSDHFELFFSTLVPANNTNASRSSRPSKRSRHNFHAVRRRIEIGRASCRERV
eukprot:TRINITY_DN2994_c0_g1_i2.p1 TRINITY_DN2994_c0_g1~~TRINITY_DN2994_c0_g1_i2.p1  ORF type:complete len:337 (-),score=64.13 TRINITY_DN2994_c0_g1_i2:95-1105(-)